MNKDEKLDVVGLLLKICTASMCCFAGSALGLLAHSKLLKSLFPLTSAFLLMLPPFFLTAGTTLGVVAYFVNEWWSPRVTGVRRHTIIMIRCLSILVLILNIAPLTCCIFGTVVGLREGYQTGVKELKREAPSQSIDRIR